MTLEAIYTMLKETGYPVAFHSFKRSTGKNAPPPPAPPFIVYLTPNNTDISADSIVAVCVLHVRIEVYTAEKNTQAEKAVEQVLKVHRIFYEKSETAIESEGLYEAIYEFDTEG